MTSFAEFKNLNGEWIGEYHLWLNPETPVSKSATSMQFKQLPGGNFVQMEYSWEDKGKPQYGTIIFGLEEKRKRIVASWIDTWHMGQDIMSSEGLMEDDNNIKFKGSYRAPEGPNWEWRTEIKIRSEKEIDFLMYNIHPAFGDLLAVKVEYLKQL